MSKKKSDLHNSVCTITFLYLDCQVTINEPFFHFFIPSVSAWMPVIFLRELMLYFCIWFLKHLGTYSRWRLTLFSTFIFFHKFFHFWVWAFYNMLYQDCYCLLAITADFITCSIKLFLLIKRIIVRYCNYIFHVVIN